MNTLPQDLDPNMKETKPDQTQSNPKTEDPTTLKPNYPPTNGDPHKQSDTALETPDTEKDLIKNSQDIGDFEPGKLDSGAGADQHVQETTSVGKGTTKLTDAIGAPGMNPTADGDPHAPKVIPGEGTTSLASYPPSETPSEIKPDSKPSSTNVKASQRWKKAISKFRFFFSLPSKRSPPKTSDGNESPTTSLGGSDKNLKTFIENDLDYIKKGTEKLKAYNEKLDSAFKAASKSFEHAEKKENVGDLEVLRNAMIKLKLHIPKVDAGEIYSQTKLELALNAEQDIPSEVRHIIPQVPKDDVFIQSVEFKDFEARYDKLPANLKLCLLCFSIFPEDAIIKKSLMVQWWACEGFVEKEKANGCFDQLIEKGYIEAVNKHRSRSVRECRMHPFYRSALVILAEKAMFFKFDSDGKAIQDFSGSCQACLVGDGVISHEDLEREFNKKASPEKADLFEVLKETLAKVHLIINAKERRIELKPDWFSMMKNVNFIHLGSWRDTDYVEVDSTQFLEKVGNMDYLRFLSLQGVANVIALPPSISKFKNLEILDVRSCHNLETIPEEIGLLRSLTQLDMSDCTLLVHMPKTLSHLENLEVLKGFVVGNDSRSCTLADLSELNKLKKLCVYTGLREFPNETHVAALGKFLSLLNLRITWGARANETPSPTDRAKEIGSPKPTEKKPVSGLKKLGLRCFPSPTEIDRPKGNGTPKPKQMELPASLKKLDLRCFPTSKTPKWLDLRNQNFAGLEKLYIRGGEFSDLGQYQDSDGEPEPEAEAVKKATWKVTDLRLKFLSKIEMEWVQLQELFPALEYLEQVDCPKLTFFPCDANGIWNKN